MAARRVSLLAVTAMSAGAFAQNVDVAVPVPSPSLGEAAWVMLEIWPTVKDVTLVAYFLNDLSGKNQNLCAATKAAIDRDAAATAKAQGVKPTAYRLCMTVADARKRRFIAAD